ncbi:uncharacterized protein LOC116350571 [Contarinia nasturtii]|uniref:uncharacterized protein LOC116350571 n=1 Tax=Contarinia nasturtii TaxID=265458 RepID=UPI0012D3785D|nr:uncharacterized protein LOC116350571 [Contarinia nasturtii]
MDNSEPIVIDSDSESEKWTKSDKNHNIDKNIPCMEVSSCVQAHSTIEKCSADNNVQQNSIITQKSGTIQIDDSDDDEQYDEREKEEKTGSSNDSSATVNVEEPTEPVDLINPKPEPISARTRSTRRPNNVSYCEDGPSTSHGISNTDQSSSYRSEFPKSTTKPKFKVEPSRIPKNDDKKVFCSNYLYKSFCFLCGSSDKHLAVHYARKHPDTEVFISRLSPAMAARIRKQDEEFVQIDDQIHGLCFFCEELMTMQKDSWMKHLLIHTGEQNPFYCSGCKKLQKTKAKHDNCSKEKVTSIFDINSSAGDLCGFICNTCNYLQIQSGNLDNHIFNEHESYDENITEELYSKVVLVKVPAL